MKNMEINKMSYKLLFEENYTGDSSKFKQEILHIFTMKKPINNNKAL